MSTPAAAPVAAPTADVSTATAGDPLDSLFDGPELGAIPATDFSPDAVAQLGDAPRAKPAETVRVEDGKPVTETTEAAATEDAAAPGEADDDESVGEPYSIDAKGRVRDANGKFTKSPEDRATAEAKAAEQQPAGDAKPQPFRFRTLGETHELEGAEVDPATGDIRIKGERAGLLREAMNALHVRNVEHIPTIQKITERNQALERQLAEATQGQTLKEQQAEAMLSRLDAAIGEPDEAKAIEMFFSLRESRPQLLKDAEIEYWKKQAGKPASTPAPAAAREEPDAGRTTAAPGLPDPQEALAGVSDYVETLAIEHAYQDITAKDWQQFNARVERTPLAYIKPATAAHVKAHGVTLGQPVFDTDALQEDIDAYVSGLREQRAIAKRREELAADRSRRTTPQIATPPSVTAATPAARAPSTGFTSKDDFDRWLDSTEI